MNMFPRSILPAELRNQYRIGFFPRSTKAGKWNKLKVNIAEAPGRKGLTVLAPDGYFY